MSPSSFFFFFFFKLVILVFLILGERHVTLTTAQWKGQNIGGLRSLVKKNERSTIFSTEYGDISEARLTDGNQAFQLHFITLEPNSLFLPVFLHYDMVFYVLTGSGRLSYLDEDDKEHRRLRRGDVHRLRCGSVFFIQSDLENERQKLRIIAIFDNTEYDFDEPASGPYSSISDLVRGFDETVLSAIFKESGALVEEIRYGTRPPAIIHGLQQHKKKKKKNRVMLQETVEYGFMEEMYNILDLSNKNKQKSKLFNIYDKDPDFKNDNGWSTVVDKKKYAPLKGSKYGVFMVYLTEGSMMGPHWNPVATEITVADKGKGMVHIVCPRMMDGVSKCNDSSRYFVEEGDVLAIPRFHGMAQMAFDNESFVFMGFSTSTKNNHPQYLAGKASVPRTLDKHIMAASLGINVTTFDKLWDRQAKSIILNCTSCAEEEWMKLMEDIEKERQREEEKRREEEEEAQKREEEKRKEEEEARKREEEEAKEKEEEEERKKEEEAKEKEEEEERKKEEEAAEKKREIEEAWKKWAEEMKKWQEQQRREQEKQEQQRREEEERKRQEQEEEEREKQEQREREEQQRREKEEEERKRQEQEEEEREKQEQQEREREEQQRREKEEEERKRQEQEQQQQEEEEEERKRQEQKEWERQEQERKQEEQEEREARQREKEQEQQREEQEAREREKEQAEEAQREREAQAKREEQEETPEGQGQGGEDQGEQEEWTDKERESKQTPMAAEAESNKHQGHHRKNKMVSKNGQEES